jgi:hypothetical protein
MLYVWVQRFDVTGGRRNILGSEWALSKKKGAPISLDRNIEAAEENVRPRLQISAHQAEFLMIYTFPEIVERMIARTLNFWSDFIHIIIN